MEALLISIPFLVYFYLRIRLGSDISPQEYEEIVFKEGIKYYNAHDFVKAFRYFDREIKEYPKSSVAYLYRGKCHYHFENWEAALGDFHTSVELDSSLAEPVYWRGLCHYHLEEYHVALVELKRASEMYQDKNPEILRLIGKLEFRNANFESAKQRFRIAASLGDNQSNILLQTLFYSNIQKASS